MARRNKQGDMSPFGVLGRVLSRDARALAKVAAPEDAKVADAMAIALRDPDRVRKLVAGLIDDVRVPA